MPVRRTLAATVAALALSAAPAAAMPAATVTVTPVAPQTFTFTSSPCMFGFCGYSWRGYGQTSNRLGFTMGYGQTLTYRFAPGVYNVVVTVGGKCSATGTASCPAYGSVYGIDAR